MENIRYKILLVEDNKLDQMAFEKLIQDDKLPYDYTIIASVAEAKQILACEQFDIIIADYSLGDGTAFDILTLAKNTPFIFITGTGNEEIALKAWKAGAYDYLIKDIERSYLKALPITVENTIKHKKTEQQVRLLSGAIMSTSDSVYIADMENNIIFVNSAFCRTYGYKKEEIIGQDSNILWLGKNQCTHSRSVFQMFRHSGEIRFYHKRKDGSIIPVSLSRSIIKDLNGKHIAVVSVARDITEQILVEDELRELNKNSEQQNQLRNQLAADFCHQLKTEITELNNIISDDQAQSNIERSQQIISDFSDILQILMNKIQLERTDFDIRLAVRQATKVLSPSAAEKNIQIDTYMPDDALVVNADYTRTVQVLCKLLDNAINTTPQQGNICIRTKDAANEIIVEVEDDGSGIEDELAEKIFDRLELVKNQSENGAEQMVLGLALARQLLEAQDGHIWAENLDSKGKVISFTLPKTQTAQPVASGASNEQNTC